MTFHITGPGLYVNSRGERVEIMGPSADATFPWIDSLGRTYRHNGSWSAAPNNIDPQDIIGVWTASHDRLDLEYEIPDNPHVLGFDEEDKGFKSVTYDLTECSGRFLALEAGRSVQYTTSFGHSVIISTSNMASYADRLIQNGRDWSLVPETKRVVTKEYIFQDCHGGLHKARRTEEDSKKPVLWKCLGAIEGSEQEEGIEV